jgi:hypothetical protein
MGRFKEARSIFEEAFANSPNNPGGYVCKAVADNRLLECVVYTGRFAYRTSMHYGLGYRSAHQTESAPVKRMRVTSSTRLAELKLRPIGLLATFDVTDTWVNHQYKNGVGLAWGCRRYQRPLPWSGSKPDAPRRADIASPVACLR